MPADVQRRAPGVPWGDMRRLRNVIAHSYHDIRLTIIWETVREDIPKVVAPLRALLETEDVR